MTLEIKNVTKQFKDVVAVNSLSLELHDNIYGLLGPNGAGKSTLINLIIRDIYPTSGQINWNGTEISKSGNKYLDDIGYMPQYPSFYRDFTCLNFMKYMAVIKGLKKDMRNARVEELLEWVNLQDKKNKKVKELSGGMKQRLGIAQAMLNNPQILILDEPTAGLDPKERIRFRKLINEVGKDKIVILATHILSDISNIADEVIIMNQGIIQAAGKTETLISDISEKMSSYDLYTDALEGVYMHYFGE